MTFDLRWASVQQPTPGGCIKTDYVGITKIQTVLTRQMHTVTKAKRNVQKLLPAVFEPMTPSVFEPMTPSRGPLSHQGSFKTWE